VVDVHERGPVAAPRRAGTVRLYTHNIYARRADWSARRQLLIDGIADLDPDIVFFQEEVLTPEYDQAADILGSGWHVAHSAGRSERESSGIAIASRWPVLAVEEIDLTVGGPPIDEFAWAALVVTTETPSGPLLLVNHFPDAAADRENERERQAVIVARRVAELSAPDDIPVILGGDLDAEPDAASVRFLLGRQSLDGHSTAFVRAWDVAHPGMPCWTLEPGNGLVADTMPGWPYRQIDHILVACSRDGLSSMLVEGCERMHDRPRAGVWASDHYGLVADLRDRRPLTRVSP
jgi:endonuclease/exonuclease/phosphatase family metal-dependent hydrolase